MALGAAKGDEDAWLPGRNREGAAVSSGFERSRCSTPPKQSPSRFLEKFCRRQPLTFRSAEAEKVIGQW